MSENKVGYVPMSSVMEDVLKAREGGTTVQDARDAVEKTKDCESAREGQESREDQRNAAAGNSSTMSKSKKSIMNCAKKIPGSRPGSHSSREPQKKKSPVELAL